MSTTTTDSAGRSSRIECHEAVRVALAEHPRRAQALSPPEFSYRQFPPNDGVRRATSECRYVDSAYFLLYNRHSRHSEERERHRDLVSPAAADGSLYRAALQGVRPSRFSISLCSIRRGYAATSFPPPSSLILQQTLLMAQRRSRLPSAGGSARRRRARDRHRQRSPILPWRFPGSPSTSRLAAPYVSRAANG